MIGALVLALEWDGVRAYELLQVKGRLNMLDFRMWIENLWRKIEYGADNRSG